MDRPDIITFVTDPQLLGLTLSPAQETLLRAIYGLQLDADQQDLWRLCTGREHYAPQGFGEATVLAGARSGKDSRIAAPIACFEALLGGHDRHLSKGERGIIPLVAQDARASKIAFTYIRDYLTGSSILARSVAEVFTSDIMLTNGLSISCFPSTLRSLRGWSIPAAVLDELAFFRFEGAADSDAEIQASIRRGMLAFEETRLVKISTPYMKAGVLHDDFQRAFGHDDPDLLCWRAPSTLMNPSIRSARLDRERRLDPARFSREYEAEFVDDLAAFLPAAWVDDAVVPGRHELPPIAGTAYVGAVDPSGGGADDFTFAVVHGEQTGADRRVVQDLMRGWGRRGPRLDLEGIVKEICRLAKAYGLTHVQGDRYAAGWVRERFQAEGLRYEEASRDRSEAYLEVEPLFAQGRMALLDHPHLVRECKGLERRPRAGGRTMIDHPRGRHDDYANALALAAAEARGDAVEACGVLVEGGRPRRLSFSDVRQHVGPRSRRFVGCSPTLDHEER